MFDPHGPLLLDILIPGYEEDKEIVKPLIESVQKELDWIRRNDINAAFYFGKRGEHSWEQLQEFLKKNCHSKYFVFTPPNYKIEETFVRDILQQIKFTLPVALEQNGIYLNPKTK